MALSPLDESGTPVDWWFLYKVPKLSGSGGMRPARGFEYAYFDCLTERVLRSPYTLDSDNGALFHTLDRLFANPQASTGWLLYNDQPPSGPMSNLGHTKGVIGFDVASNSAFWLLHSWPKFPAADSSAQPSPMYGQTFLCVALDLAGARALATQMHTYQEPEVYDARIPTTLAVDDPLRLLSAGVSNSDPAGSSVLDLRTAGGVRFKVIAKNRNWNQDFWNDLVVGAIDASIDVETWIRVSKTDVIPPTSDPTGKYTVEDIKYISLADVGLPWAWPESKDHAKWGISVAGAGDWVCVGDINRMTSQALRGGCTIAFQQPTLWAMLAQTDRFVVPDGSPMTPSQAETALRSTVRALRHPL